MDNDTVTSSDEDFLENMTTNPRVSDTYKISSLYGFSRYVQYGDNEIRARKSEELRYYDQTKDWSSPGSQYGGIERIVP